MGSRVKAGIIIVAVLVVAGCSGAPAPPGGMSLANDQAPEPEPPPSVPSPAADFTRGDGTTDMPDLDNDDVFADLAVCTEDAFDEDAAACREDQADTLDRTSVVYCSATAAGATEPIVGQLLLDDEVVQTSSATVNPDTIRPVWFGFELDDALLPGGQWSCDWSVEGGDNAVERPFPIPGPQGELVDTAACDGDATNAAGLCDPSAESAADAVAQIACSATLAGLDSSTLQVDLHDEFGLAASADPVTVDSTLTTFAATFSAGEDGFDPGTHTCVWRVDDEPAAAAELQVG